MTAKEQLAGSFGTWPELLHAHAQEKPGGAALIQGQRTLSYAQLDAWVDRIAASLQRDRVGVGCTIAIAASASMDYVALFLAGLRAGAVVAPLPVSATRDSLVRMIADCGATHLFLDADAAVLLAGAGLPECVQRIAVEDLDLWMLPEGARPVSVAVAPEAPFNIIYSSGTTGEPKGIVQPNSMRWAHIVRGQSLGLNSDSVMLIATPLYSNTTLVGIIPAMAWGGAVVLMPKFDASGYLALAQQHRVTHTILVPVQYRRILALPDFDGFDLSSFKMKLCTSAPFGAELKAEVLRRWPGGLTEYYGMTEGGATCVLAAHVHPDKLHTVGQPRDGHEIKLIDENGVEVPKGEAGECVGRSPAMMTGYHNQPDKTRQAEWYDPQGRRFIRTGDTGRYDEDGFLLLQDRKKDMIISGGFNIYPSDLEAALLSHPAVAEAAVVGVPSEVWGETPVAYVTLVKDAQTTARDIEAWANGRLGKTQRLSRVSIVAELPRNAVGKILKRELRALSVPSASGLD